MIRVLRSQGWAIAGGLLVLAGLPDVANAQGTAVGGIRDPGLVGRGSPSARVGFLGTSRTSASSLAGLGGGSGITPLGAGALDAGRARANRMGMLSASVGELYQPLNAQNGLTLSGFTMSGQNASRVLNSMPSSNSMRGSQSYVLSGGRDFFGNNRRGPGGLLSLGRPLDQHRMVFGRNMPKASPPIPPPASKDSSAAESQTIQPALPPQLDVRTQARADATYHLARAVERLFGSPSEAAPGFESVRQAELEFDRVRRAVPDDPRAYLWTAVLALRMDNVNQAMALWRQCLTRFEKRRDLDSLRLDFESMGLSPELLQQARQKSPPFLQQLSTELTLRLSAAHDSARVSGASLSATLLWMADESKLPTAVEVIRNARTHEMQRLSPGEHSPGLGLLYELLRQRAARGPTVNASPPARESPVMGASR